MDWLSLSLIGGTISYQLVGPHAISFLATTLICLPFDLYTIQRVSLIHLDFHDNLLPVIIHKEPIGKMLVSY
jgi:hypothetical protein